jgi:hypothetical protein
MRQAEFNDSGNLVIQRGVEAFKVVDPSNRPIVPYILDRSFVAVNSTNTTSEETLATIVLPAGVLGLHGYVEVEAFWAQTNNANAKTGKVYFGATAISTQTLTSLALGKQVAKCGNRGSAASQFSEATNTSAAAVVQAASTAAIDTTNRVAITITSTKGTGTDTVTLEGYVVRVFPTPNA